MKLMRAQWPWLLLAAVFALAGCSSDGAAVPPAPLPGWTAQRMFDEQVRPYFVLSAVPEDLDSEASTHVTGIRVEEPSLNHESRLVEQTYRKGDTFVLINTAMVAPGQPAPAGTTVRLPNGQTAWVKQASGSDSYTVIVREQNLVGRITGSVGLDRLMALAATLKLEMLPVAGGP